MSLDQKKKLDIIKECNNDYALESLKEDFEKEIPLNNEKKLKDNIEPCSKFEVLAETCHASFSEMQLALQDMLKLKDELLIHHLPPPLLYRLTIIFGQIFRSFSDLNTPINEILRLIKIYSPSWEKNGTVLKRVHDMYENKKQLLNLAIKRLAIVEKNTKLIAKEKKILNWERLFIKLSESKGHGRRWRFQIENFRKKTSMGHEELIKWLKRESSEFFEHRSLISNNDHEKSKDNHLSENDNKILNENFEGSDFRLDLNKSNNNEKLTKKISDDNYINEIESLQDFFSQDSSDDGKKEIEKENKHVVDCNVQTDIEMIDKSIWTGEPNYTRFFILRIFKPTEFYSKKINFQIKLGDTIHHSNTFDIIKKVVIVDNKSHSKNTKSKVSNENGSNKEESDRKVDINKYEDFVFEVKDYSLNKEILGNSASDNIEIKLTVLDNNNELIAYTILQLYDVQTLDLPILYHKDMNEMNTVDQEYESNYDLENLTSSRLLDPLRLTNESLNDYGIFSKRSPFIFDMYTNKNSKSNEAFCRLPLMFFWVRKQNVYDCNKKTNTESLNDLIETLTGFNIEKHSKIEIQKLLGPKNINERACSPIEIYKLDKLTDPLKNSIPETELFSVHNENNDEIHEEYQMKIDELKLVIYQLENEIIKMKSLNDIKHNNFTHLEKKEFDSHNVYQNKKKIYKINEKNKRENENNSLFSHKSHSESRKPIWTKQLQDGFYDRLKKFNHKSYLHQKELIERYVSQEAAVIEQQMAVQHRLDTKNINDKILDDFCLPAVFMPHKSINNVFNPRARQYFHSSGANIRLTQPPSIFQLPSLPSRTTLSVINLYDLGRRYEAGEPDFLINEFINSTAGKLLSESQKEEKN